MTDLATLLRRSEFPRSSGYDPRWAIDQSMGPNALWLCEWLRRTGVEGMDLYDPALGLKAGADR